MWRYRLDDAKEEQYCDAVDTESQIPEVETKAGSERCQSNHVGYETTTRSSDDDKQLRPTMAVAFTWKPTIVLVHGGWQTASSLDHLVAYLRSSLYKVLVPDLPSSIARPAVTSWEADVAAIRDCIVNETGVGSDVVLVMHSYGAAVGCEALGSVPLSRKGTKGRIIRLGFIAGWVPKVGGSLWPKGDDRDWMPGFVLSEDLITVYDGANRFYNHLPQDKANELAHGLTMQSRPALTSTLTHNSYQNVPSAYLLTTLDRAMPPKLQARIAKAAGSVVTLSRRGHVPFADEDGAKEVGKWIREQLCGDEKAKL